MRWAYSTAPIPQTHAVQFNRST